MKVIWEPADIRAGRRYSRAGITEVWMIARSPRSQDGFVSVSLSDGLITEGESVDELAKELTVNEYVPIELLHQ